MSRPLEPILSEKEPFMPYYAASYKQNFISGYQESFHLPLKPETNQRHKVTTNWQDTLERSIKNIVSIKACRPRGIDTELPGSFTATGFIVDPEHGIILSNRHVVSISPLEAYAVLCNYEEIKLKPIYRDPVHDFGFFRYDTTQIKFLLDIQGIELYPQGAKVGQDIRVVGNDAGEKLSILSGTLARLDREAPDYGLGEYNDFNTFYFQAASGTSAGSSGSPVLDLQGRAIALNAGGASASSSSYYLPLDRVQRALKLITTGNQWISRGTLQTTFEYQSYDNLLQLGLSRSLERGLREQQQKNSEGLLVVKSVLPDGPADGVLEPGDILLTCNGQLLPRLFIDLEEQLDNAISGKSTTLSAVILRAGEPKEIKLKVQDLHSITPYRYVEFGGGVLNELSYQTARSYGLSLKDAGVYVGAAGFILGSTARVLRKSIIVGINHQPIKSLDDFVSVVQSIDQDKRVPIHFYSLSRPMKLKVMIIHLDWRWHQFRMAIRNDATGCWDYTILDTPLKKVPPELPASTTTTEYQLTHNTVNDPITALTKSIVSIDCCPPFIIDGSKNAHSYGAGIIVSLSPPLILCDRDTVPISISVISVTFQNSLTISADLVFLHPFYNFALLRFDPTPIVKAGIEMHVAQLVNDEFTVGENVTYVGLSGRNEINVKKTTIISKGPIRTQETRPARWRAMNVEVFKVNDGTLASLGGLLADSQGRMRAIWMSFSIDNDQNELSSVLGGLSCRLIKSVVDSFSSGYPATVKGLDAEFWPLQISNARLVGVLDKWIDRIQQIVKEEQTIPSVVYVLGITDMSSPSGSILKPGDIVLAIDGRVITSISKLDLIHNYGQVPMTILRDGEEQDITVPATHYDGQETTQVVGWQGMLLQHAHQAAKEQVQKQVPEGVYVSCCLLGSPAQANLTPNVWITHINQMPVKTLDHFLKAIDLHRTQNNKHCIEQQELLQNMLNLQTTTTDTTEDQDIPNHVQIKYITMDNVSHVKAIKLDTHYWPTWHVRKDATLPYGWNVSFLS
ncbi:MAG: hypothetical protein EXX96DRAFT_607260 [Benjaminiella poitrasii]|nr:MAG: hypothetical protein EXX96DRAFT_607260 [Benjaminiella poitrasii]